MVVLCYIFNHLHPTGDVLLMYYFVLCFVLQEGEC